MYATILRGTFTDTRTREDLRGFDLPAGVEVVVELHSDTVEGRVLIQDPRGGTVAQTAPVKNKGRLKARFEGPLRGLGARVEIVGTPRARGDYLVVLRVKQ